MGKLAAHLLAQIAQNSLAGPYGLILTTVYLRNPNRWMISW
jgi:hypothetical protein